MVTADPTVAAPQSAFKQLYLQPQFQAQLQPQPQQQPQFSIQTPNSAMPQYQQAMPNPQMQQMQPMQNPQMQQMQAVLNPQMQQMQAVPNPPMQQMQAMLNPPVQQMQYMQNPQMQQVPCQPGQTSPMQQWQLVPMQQMPVPMPNPPMQPMQLSQMQQAPGYPQPPTVMPVYLTAMPPLPLPRDASPKRKRRREDEEEREGKEELRRWMRAEIKKATAGKGGKGKGSHWNQHWNEKCQPSWQRYFFLLSCFPLIPIVLDVARTDGEIEPSDPSGEILGTIQEISNEPGPRMNVQFIDHASPCLHAHALDQASLLVHLPTANNSVAAQNYKLSENSLSKLLDNTPEFILGKGVADPRITMIADHGGDQQFWMCGGEESFRVFDNSLLQVWDCLPEWALHFWPFYFWMVVEYFGLSRGKTINKQDGQLLTPRVGMHMNEFVENQTDLIAECILAIE